VLRSARHRAKRLLHRGDVRDALAAGFTNGYRRARLAMNRARRLDTPEAFHEWRKTVKAHAFHVEVLARAGVKELGPRVAPLERLGETLGAAHDLTLLEVVLRGERQGAAALLVKLHARRRALDAGALALGRRLFGQPPRALRGVIAGCPELKRLGRASLSA